MTREEFGTLAACLKAAYTQDSFLPNTQAIQMWYSQLRDLDFETAKRAVFTYINQEVFPPTIAGIRQKVMMSGEEMSEGEAWGLVYKAVCNGGYNAQVEFEHLPKIIQKAVGTWQDIHRMALMESKEIEVARAQFLNSYRAVLQREKNLAVLPQNLQNMIEERKYKEIER